MIIIILIIMNIVIMIGSSSSSSIIISYSYVYVYIYTYSIFTFRGGSLARPARLRTTPSASLGPPPTPAHAWRDGGVSAINQTSLDLVVC